MKKTIIASATFFAPLLAFAQTDVKGVLENFTGILNAAVPVIFAIAVVLFLWGLTKFITSADNEDEHKKGRDIMIWGIVAIFIMASVFGLVKILQNTFKVDSNDSITLPKLPTRN